MSIDTFAFVRLRSLCKTPESCALEGQTPLSFRRPGDHRPGDHRIVTSFARDIGR